MSAVNIIQIRHPSGKLFDDYCRFVEDHPDASYFQSEGFIRFIDDWQEADRVLLLAVRKEGLKDPGARPASYRPGDIFNIPADKVVNKTSKSDPDAANEEGKIAGSLLAVNIRDEVPDSIWFRPFAVVYRMLTARTIVYGGPLLGEATRLQNELTAKALLNALHKQVHRRSIFTQLQNSFDVSDYLPLFREMGYKFFGCHLPDYFPDVLTLRRSIERVANCNDSILNSKQDNLTLLKQQVDNMPCGIKNQENNYGYFLRINQGIRYYLFNTGYKLFKLFKGKK
jgi:hypothetical protein